MIFWWSKSMILPLINSLSAESSHITTVSYTHLDVYKRQQLGRVAQAQRQWAQALQYLLKDLEISTEFKDDYGVGITLRSLARLHRESGDASVLAATAQVLGVSAAEVAALFAGALEE